MTQIARPRLLLVSILGSDSEKFAENFSVTDLAVDMQNFREIHEFTFENVFYDYIVVNAGFPPGDTTFFNENRIVFNKVAQKAKHHGSKLLFVFPYFSSIKEKGVVKEIVEEIFGNNSSSAILYVGNYPQGDIDRIIVRNVFSLRAYGQEQILGGDPIEVRSNSHVHEEVLKVEPVMELPIPHPVAVSTNELNPLVQAQAAFSQLKKNKNIAKKVKSLVSVRLSKEKKPSLPKKRAYSKILALVSIFTLLLVLIPYIASFPIFIASSFRIRQADNVTEVNVFDNLIKNFGDKSEALSSYYVSVSGVGSLYTNSLGFSRISVLFTRSFFELVKAKNGLYGFIEDIFSSSDFPFLTSVGDIVFSYNRAYSDLGFAITELDTLPLSKIAYWFIDKPKVESLRSSSEILSRIIQDLPELLGKENSVTYAVVLQNSDVLRSTGGKIEGISLLTFESGTLQTTEYFNINKEDKAFAGSISAPKPLTDYLGIVNWSLADSNWDSAYPNSSERIKWFIDKELDRKADGVIAISDETLRKIIQTDKSRADYIPSNWSEFLKIGTESLVNYLKDMNDQKAKFMVDALDGKEILLYVPFDQSQEAFADLGYAGSFKTKDCGFNCYHDGVSIVESNFGTPASNISREGEFKASLEEGVVKRSFTYYVKNKEQDTYKTYIRLVTDDFSGFSPLTILTKEGKRTLDPEVFASNSMKEAGVYLEIEAGETVGINYQWESILPVSIAKEGSYKFTIFKQPGVSEYPLTTTISAPEDLNLAPQEPALTKGTAFTYNTVLARDVSSRIFWK